MTRRTILLFLTAACLVGLVLERSLAATSETTGPRLTVVDLEGPARLQAGDDATILVSTVEAEGTASVVALSGLASTELQVEIVQGRGNLRLPTWLTETAGQLTLLTGGATLEIDIAPGPAAGTAEILVGPRTIVADGTDRSLGVVAPRDQFGNAAGEGINVVFHRTRRTGEPEAVSIETRNSIAAATFFSGVVAGPSDLWVTTDDITGVTARLEEVPGIATEVTVRLPVGLPPADGRTLVELATELLRDQFGNVLPDGIDARFVAISSEGTQEIPAVVQNGRLRTHLVAPSEPSVLEVHAVIHGMSSEPATLTFGSAIASLQGVAFHTAEGLRVEVTDAVGPSGALVANGTPILIDGIETILQQGDATMLLSPGRVDTEPLIVVALGTELLVDIEDAS